MSRLTTPPVGLASGSHCLPASAWGTRRQTTPHARTPQHHTQRQGGISLPHVPLRGSGAVSSPGRLETATAGSAQPSRVAQGRLH